MLDAWSCIANLIESDKDKCHLIMSCKGMSKCRFFFNERVKIEKIVTSKFFNHFINVKVNNFDVLFPPFITHLTFGWWFDQPIENRIPSTITHLRFGNHFDQPIENCIPSSVVHLKFDTFFNQPIKNNIPTSVTHLTFGWHFEQAVSDIPSSVTHLFFNTKESIDFDTIPSTVRYLQIRGEYCYKYFFNEKTSKLSGGIVDV